MTPPEAAVAAPNRLMTADEFWEFCRLPENENKWLELVRGEVIEVPPPTKPHCRVAANIVYELEGFVRRRRRGYVLSNDAGVILERDPDTVRGPDVALYEDADHFRDLHPKYGEVPPVLAVEVLSPSDTYTKALAKVQEYLRNGVRVVWLADPDGRSLTAFRPGGQSQVLTADSEVAGEPELPGFRCRVGDFFLLPGDFPDPNPSGP